MRRAFLIASVAIGAGAPAFAQHQGHGPPQSPPAVSQQPNAPARPAVGQHDHGEAQQPEAQIHMEHAAGDEAAPPPKAGNDVPPDPPSDHAADAFFSKADMERARAILDAEHGRVRITKLMANELEFRGADGEDGYRWDAEGWHGGDINRLVLKTEGEGAEDLESAEVQALYSRAIGVYTDFQIGIRHDIEPQPNRTYLALGFESLLPYWFEAEGAIFVGESGQMLGRLEGRYDLLLTQRIVLQPSVELNLALQDDAAIGTGSGLSDAEVGLRLRYEIVREFGPYIGVLWERSFGDTADFARLAGEETETTSFVAGVRAWF